MEQGIAPLPHGDILRIYRISLLFLFICFLAHGQLMMKRICNLPTGPHDELTHLICWDTDRNGLNEIIFERIIATYISAWMVMEYRPMNHYELVFADTGAYPYPPGITTGNFRPYDVGDIDRDSLTDLVGPNIEQALNDSIYYIITTQESPNYSYYPSFLSWWFRTSNSGYGYTYYFTPDLDYDERKEILTYVKTDSTRLTLIENVGNNQNIPVWNRFTYGPSFAFGDFDQDSLRDFVTANPGSSGEVYFFENTGDNQYDRLTIDTVHLPNGTDVFSGNDLDGDGKPEFFVAFARWVGGYTWDFFLYMWEATGNNTYQRTLIDQKTITVSRSTGRRSKCGDIDGDGIDELVWATPTQLFVYKATGNNQFQQVWQWNQDHGTNEALIVNIYDMNKNGYNEIVVGGSGKTSIFEVEAVQVLRPNGGETFHADSQELIQWQTFHPPRCDSLSLFYSINNGNTYNLITHGLSGNDTSYLWTVPNINSDSCKVKIIAYGPGWQYDESDGMFSISSSAISEIASLPLAMTLSMKVFPNPVKSLTAIHYSLPAEGKVSLQLYDISGRLVRTLVDEYKKPGNCSVTLNSKTLSSGVYFLLLKTEEKRIIERLVIIK
jgi:hypothetical protein